MSYKELFEKLWDDYLQITPSAKKVHAILSADQKDIINDHIALRTFNHPDLGLDKLAIHFENCGYTAKGDYEFTEKKLVAKHYEHCDPEAPKVFISELLLEKCSDNLRAIVNSLISQVPKDYCQKSSFLYSGAPWKISHKDYLALLEESEYAAWMSAWGYHANHFTVSVNHLNNYDSILDVNNKLKQEGFKLNDSGGEVKGNPSVLLEQSSTLADQIEVSFTDGTFKVPSCFYEFAKRYPTKEGKIYTGFVAANADKIFESTNVN
jgi:hypothetical protein